MRRILVVSSLLVIIFALSSGVVNVGHAQNFSFASQANIPIPTPTIQKDGGLRFASPSLSHWWLLDYWDTQSFGLIGNSNVPSQLSGKFVAVQNTIQGLQANDAILYLPLNAAYGTDSGNCVWFQFDVLLTEFGQVSWFIWDVRCPGTNSAIWPLGDYHYTVIGLSYVVGDDYSFALSTSSGNTIKFTINDTSIGTSWSKNDWAWSVPSTQLLPLESTFSPSSTVEGYTTPGASLSGVPTFQTTIGDGILENRHYSAGDALPSGINTDRFSLGDSSHWMWSMLPGIGTDHMDYSGLSPTAVSFIWAKSGYFVFGKYELQQSTTSSSGPWVTIDTMTSADTTRDYVGNLSPGKTYWWQIVDHDCCFLQVTTNVLRITQPSNATIISKLSRATSVEVSWTNNALYRGMVSFDSYRVMVSSNGGDYSQVGIVSSSSTRSYTVTGLSPSTTYSFHIFTIDRCIGCTDAGTSGSTSNTVKESTPATLTARVSARSNTADVGQNLSFTCESSGGVSPYSYFWTFGDNENGFGSATAHTYQITGIMKADCVVYDGLSSGATDTSTVTVSSDPAVSIPQSTKLSVDVGQVSQLSVEAQGGSKEYSYEWDGLPPGCATLNTASISCQATSAGPFQIQVKLTDSNGYTVPSGVLEFRVNPDPNIDMFAASATSVDVGHTITFTLTASAGTGTFSYSYLGLPDGCDKRDASTISCSPRSVGLYIVTAMITDSNGFTVGSAPVSISVTTGPITNSFTATPKTIDLGQATTLIVAATHGEGVLSFSYTGLPEGCKSSDSPIMSCNPSSIGTFTITVSVGDEAMETSNSSTTLIVNPTLEIISFSSSPTNVEPGQKIVLSVSATGGTGPLSYSYAGLPADCATMNSSSLSCVPSQSGVYNVRISINDQTGRGATSSISLTVNVNQTSNGPANSSYLLIVVIAISAVITGTTGMILSRQRRKAP